MAAMPSICLAGPSIWTPTPEASSSTTGPLRRSATWNSKFPKGLDLDLSLPYAAPLGIQKPRLSLRLATATASDVPLPSRRFDPFADDDAQNVPPQRSPVVSPTGRRRAPSFSASRPSAASAVSLAALASLSSGAQVSSSHTPAIAVTVASSPAPPAVVVRGAPSPFLARHYPTSDARTRLLARTLLNRIHAVGRPRSPYACNGYESECGGRGYVPSRLSECVVAC